MAPSIWVGVPALSSAVTATVYGSPVVDAPSLYRDGSVVVGYLLCGLHIAIIRNGSIIYSKIGSNETLN
jgi:hypothetical protein